MDFQIRGDGDRVRLSVMVEWRVLVAFAQALVATVVSILSLLALLEQFGIVLM